MFFHVGQIKKREFTQLIFTYKTVAGEQDSVRGNQTQVAQTMAGKLQHFKSAPIYEELPCLHPGIHPASLRHKELVLQRLHRAGRIEAIGYQYGIFHENGFQRRSIDLTTGRLLQVMIAAAMVCMGMGIE